MNPAGVGVPNTKRTSTMLALAGQYGGFDADTVSETLGIAAGHTKDLGQARNVADVALKMGQSLHGVGPAELADMLGRRRASMPGLSDKEFEGFATLQMRKFLSKDSGLNPKTMLEMRGQLEGFAERFGGNDKVNKIKQDFDNWIWQDDNRRNDLVNYYNQNYNNTVIRKYDGSKLLFPGYAHIKIPVEKIGAHQKDGAWMVLQQMGGILDHIVGAGKTLTMVLAAYKGKQMGLFKKPIIIGLKANTADLAREYKNAFPMGKVLSPKEKDFTPQNRRAFFAKMANNNWDLIVMTHDQFGKIEQPRDIQQEIIQQEIDALENDIRIAKDHDLSKRELNGLEQRKQNLEDRLNKLTLMSKDVYLKTFDEMGIDFMFVDESQQFKNLAYNRHFRLLTD
jgi:hypothetical protein